MGKVAWLLLDGVNVLLYTTMSFYIQMQEIGDPRSAIPNCRAVSSWAWHLNSNSLASSRRMQKEFQSMSIYRVSQGQYPENSPKYAYRTLNLPPSAQVFLWEESSFHWLHAPKVDLFPLNFDMKLPRRTAKPVWDWIKGGPFHFYRSSEAVSKGRDRQNGNWYLPKGGIVNRLMGLC